MVDWYVEGVEFGNCNCAYGCPCQFEALPTYGTCRGFEVMRIDKGRFGDLDLSGLRLAMLYAWPGPIFEGKGELQAIIDERADPEQRRGGGRGSAPTILLAAALNRRSTPPANSSVVADDGGGSLSSSRERRAALPHRRKVAQYLRAS